MFLKSLSMKGFKSFADPVYLEFQPGITVVVGPNGSGKSNVVDAVTWVLGAQGPRSLRSQKMEDVIFAGTSSRPQLGRAEVSLTIDNASGRLPVDLAEVTITRTLFRNGDSEYAINGTSCRLLDIQDLLSDSGVGRTQHMIIGQGQLDTVLNARPEDRRNVIEEAAGVLKHRRRRERAERRLAQTQENLERLGDVVREVRRQIRPLERQAAAARSHGAVADDLRAVRLYLASSELAELAERQRIADDALGALGEEERRIQADLDILDEAASLTAAELAGRREEDLASALGRVQGLIERTRGTTAVLRERSRALQAALDAAADVDVVSTLEAEGARLVAELRDAEVESELLAPARDDVDLRVRSLADDEAAHRARWGEGGELREAIEGLKVATARLDGERQTSRQVERALQSLQERAAVLATRTEELERAMAALAAERGQLDQDEERLRAELDVANATEARASAGVDACGKSFDTALRTWHRAVARAEALARALDELHGANGRDLLDGVAGVYGSLLDLVVIDTGWESAFEAAAGAVLGAIVVDSKSSGKAVLTRLRQGGVTGAVLSAALARPGAREMPGEPVRAHVRARADAPHEVENVLDAILANAVRVSGWEQAIDVSLDDPELVVVTEEGDRFARSGWRVRSSTSIVTRAALEEAEHQAETAAAEREAAERALEDARVGHQRARAAANDLARTLDRHGSTLARVRADLDRSARETQRLADERDGLARSEAEAVERLDAHERARADLDAEVAQLSERVEAMQTEGLAAEEAAGALGERRAALESERSELERRAAAADERRAVLNERLTEVERRLEGHVDEREAAAARRRHLEADGRALGRLAEVVEHQRTRLEGAFDTLRDDYRDQIEAVRTGGERLESLRRDRAGLERRHNEVREQWQTNKLESAEVALRTESLVDHVRRELGRQPEEIMDSPVPELPDGVSAPRHADALAEKLAGLGPVNPLALEELSALEERHRELDTQVEDIRTARRELQAVVRELDDQIMQSFAAAFADVNEHFSGLVETLFPGGSGRITLTEPADLLNTGVEIEVRPAGRNVRRVSLLSGGERSLAALVFLFAVFRSRPSPFYMMDEVEAALDDVNLTRFLGLVREFRNEAQLIIVSHQKRTMETADALYGVTMAPGGSSQVISQRIKREPQAAAS